VCTGREAYGSIHQIRTQLLHSQFCFVYGNWQRTLTDVAIDTSCRPKKRSSRYKRMVISSAEPSSSSHLRNTRSELVDTNGKKGCWLRHSHHRQRQHTSSTEQAAMVCTQPLQKLMTNGPRTWRSSGLMG